jgi:hypothetical protein
MQCTRVGRAEGIRAGFDIYGLSSMTTGGGRIRFNVIWTARCAFVCDGEINRGKQPLKITLSKDPLDFLSRITVLIAGRYSQIAMEELSLRLCEV